jgi:hypothetical protein
MCEKCVRKALLSKIETVEYKLSNYIKFVKTLSEEDLKSPDVQFQMKRVKELSDIISSM